MVEHHHPPKDSTEVVEQNLNICTFIIQFILHTFMHHCQILREYSRGLQSAKCKCSIKLEFTDFDTKQFNFQLTGTYSTICKKYYRFE